MLRVPQERLVLLRPLSAASGVSRHNAVGCAHSAVARCGSPLGLLVAGVRASGTRVPNMKLRAFISPGDSVELLVDLRHLRRGTS